MAQRKRARRRARTEVVGPQPLPRPGRQRVTPSEAAPSPAAAIWSSVRTQPAAIAVGAVVVAAALALYLRTAARDIVLGDTPELTAVALTLGVAHPPGYPMYTMLGWLFGQLPLGPLPFRVALLSVVCHAATVGVVYATALRFTRSVPAAAVAALALALEPVFWAWSLVGEVFPLNDLLSATMLLLVALWHERPERTRLLVAGALVGGLGVANHQTIALLAPAVFYVLWRRRDVLLRRPRILVNAAIAFALGLLPYLELFVAAARHPAWSWGDLQTPADLVAMFLRKDYGTGSLIVGEKFTGGSAADRLIALFAALDPLQWVLLAAGAAYAWRARRWYATYLLIAFAVAGPAFAAYSNAKLTEETTRAILERFFLLPHTVVAPLAGFAVLAAGELAGRVRLPRRAVELGAAVAGALAALALVPLSYAAIDQSDNQAARNFGNDLLSTMKPNTLFLGGGDPVVYSVEYLRTVEGARPDVTVVVLPLVPSEWYVREFRRAHRDVVVPDDRYGPGAGQIRSLIDANFGKRPIADLGDLPDNSTKGVYWFYSRGLIYDVKPIAETVELKDMAAENEATLATYRPPRHSDLGPRRAWERLTLVDYASAYYRVGREYEIAAESKKATDPKLAADLYDGARSWYRRALEVKPDLPEAKDGLERTSGK